MSNSSPLDPKPGSAWPRASRRLLTAASIIVVLGGLKLASSVVVPILLASFLAFVCIPLTGMLTRRGVPRSASIVIVVTGAAVSLIALCMIVGTAVTDFTNDLDSYQSRIDELRERWREGLADLGIALPAKPLANVLDTGALFRLVASTAGGVIASASNVFVVLLLMVFILFEAHELPDKLLRARGDPSANLEKYERISGSIYQYLHVKSVVSIATGVLVVIINWLAGVDFPILWGLVAFLFNFVPSIGSIIAAIPAVLLALILHGGVTAAWVGAGYLAINMVIGNVIEPRVMGGRLGLSPLVVLLSLFFWSYVLGPVGMLLSIPLTMIVKIVCEHDPELRAVATLLGPSDAEQTSSSKPAAGDNVASASDSQDG